MSGSLTFYRDSSNISTFAGFCRFPRLLQRTNSVHTVTEEITGASVLWWSDKRHFRPLHGSTTRCGYATTNVNLVRFLLIKQSYLTNTFKYLQMEIPLESFLFAANKFFIWNLIKYRFIRCINIDYKLVPITGCQRHLQGALVWVAGQEYTTSWHDLSKSSFYYHKT